MGFVTLLPTFTKPQTETLATRWAELLTTGQVRSKPYAVSTASSHQRIYV
jgi:hypothetical protein